MIANIELLQSSYFILNLNFVLIKLHKLLIQSYQGPGIQTKLEDKRMTECI